MRCYGCGESGHQLQDCKKVGKRPSLTMGMHEKTIGMDDNVYDVNERDDDNIGEEEYVSGDIGQLLVMRRSYLALKGMDDECL